MDLDSHKKTILRWINSCETSEQLDMCVEVIPVFINKERFKTLSVEVDEIPLKDTTMELWEAIGERRVLVAIKCPEVEAVELNKIHPYLPTY